MKTILSLTLLSGLTLFSHMASADAVRKYCARDAGHLCNGVKPGGGRIYKCLVRNRYALSPACKVTLEVLTHVIVKHAAKVCRVDVKHLCRGVRPGQGRIMRCLKHNFNQLDPACASIVKKVSGHNNLARDEYRDY